MSQRATERPVRWGVLGSCGIARRRTIPEGILPASNARLVSVFDANASANAEVAREFGAVAARSLKEFLESPLDAIYIATPACLHREQVRACLAAGKNVLCEKPLSLNAADAGPMARTAREAGLRLGTAFMMRFHSQHQAALGLIRDGALGKPVYARAQLSCWYPPIEGAWRQDPALGGGGALVDLGSHCIDLLEMFFGSVAEVACLIGNAVHAYKSEDTAVVLLRFHNGATGTVDTSFCIPDDASMNRLELYGSGGSILAEGTIGQGSRGHMIARLGAGGNYDAQQKRELAAAVEISPEAVSPYRGEVEEFSQALLDGRDLFAGALEGLRSQRVLEACYRSARSGKVVAIEGD